MNNSSDNPDNLPETEVLSAKIDELEGAMDQCIEDGDVEEYAKLNKQHKELRQKYIILMEREKAKNEREGI